MWLQGIFIAAGDVCGCRGYTLLSYCQSIVITVRTFSGSAPIVSCSLECMVVYTRYVAMTTLIIWFLRCICILKVKDIERLTHSYSCKAADNADSLHSVAIALTWFLWRELIPFGHRGLSVGTAPSHLRELITSYHPARSSWPSSLSVKTLHFWFGRKHQQKN